MQAEVEVLVRPLRVPVAVVAVAQRQCRVRQPVELLIAAEAEAGRVAPVGQVALAL